MCIFLYVLSDSRWEQFRNVRMNLFVEIDQELKQTGNILLLEIFFLISSQFCKMFQAVPTFPVVTSVDNHLGV